MGDPEEQILAAQQGDVAAFEDVAKLHQENALGYARSVLGDAQLAEDAVQEALTSAFLNIGQRKNRVRLERG